MTNEEILKKYETYVRLGQPHNTTPISLKENVLEAMDEALRIHDVMRRLPTSEDVKRWHALLVGQGEEAMLKDIEATFA